MTKIGLWQGIQPSAVSWLAVQQCWHEERSTDSQNHLDIYICVCIMYDMCIYMCVWYMYNIYVGTNLSNLIKNNSISHMFFISAGLILQPSRWPTFDMLWFAERPLLSFVTDVTDNASVSFVKYKGDYYVSTETNFMHRVDPENLETLEKVGLYTYGICHDYDPWY